MQFITAIGINNQISSVHVLRFILKFTVVHLKKGQNKAACGLKAKEGMTVITVAETLP